MPTLQLGTYHKAQSKPSTLQSLDVIFYGDSITESWRGLQVGVPVDKFKGIPEIFSKMYGGVQAAAYSISGEALVKLHIVCICRPYSKTEVHHFNRWSSVQTRVDIRCIVLPDVVKIVKKFARCRAHLHMQSKAALFAIDQDCCRRHDRAFVLAAYKW